MATTLAPLFILVFAGVVTVGIAAPEQGVWVYDVLKQDLEQGRHTFFTYKSLFNKSHVGLSIDCQGSETVPVQINWLIRESPCANEYLAINEQTAEGYLNAIQRNLMEPMPYKTAKYLTGTIAADCAKHNHIPIHEFIYKTPQIAVSATPAPTNIQKPAAENKPTGENKQAGENKHAGENKEAQNSPVEKVPVQKQAEEKPQNKSSQNVRRRRAGDAAAQSDVSKDQNNTQLTLPKENDQNEQLVRVWEDGYYLFVLQVVPVKKPVAADFKMHVTVKISYGNSYLAAVDWPLLVFYGVMGLVYIFFGIFWLVLLACNWRDLLRVQFWIGAVIFLGMLEKAVFFGEYENLNKTGQSVRGAIIVAELVSCLKRTLARMLVLIVSLGYGIVKPRLGQTFHKVLFVGVVFFILASIESCSRALSGRADQSVKLLVASVPLAVTDAIICWWIFSSLLQTTRTLRLRRNVVKLSLYRHFTNTLIFSVIASVAYMIWFMTQHRLKECITDWRELWIDDAFWHLLFSVILFVIMILWRPSANNQRYAFSPLLDSADDDDLDDEQALNDAYEGMKMRSTNSQQRNGSPRVKDDKGEDDLKWVEDNIPTSLADRVLPALDSDEEIMNTKFEVSKME